MSTRVTELGGEYVFGIDNKTRVTELGAEFVYPNSIPARVTQLGVEFLFTEEPTCKAEFIQNATSAEVDAIESADVLLGHASDAFPNGRIPTDTASITWDLSTPGQAKANVASGGVPAWVTDSPNSPPATPNPADDEFGGSAYPGETALDTAGSRRTGATGWQWRNQGTSTATVDSANGVLILTPQVNSQVRGVEQAVPAGSWKFRARIAGRIDLPVSNTVLLGMFATNNANGKLIVAALGTLSNGIIGLYSSVWSSVSSWAGDRKTPASSDPVHSMMAWLEAEYDGTTLTFRVSPTGEEGSFSKFVAETVASFLGGLTHIGLFGYADGGAPQPIALVCDTWRRVA